MHISAVPLLLCAAEPDAELLTRFIADRDETAFATLVKRHGPTVWHVCRRLVDQPADAEDAYQATFLLLVRHAAKVRNPAVVGAWLHGVAVKVATRARTRRKPEPLTAEPVALEDVTVAEAESVFHEELARLPAKFRDPLVLCGLEALSRDEAAARLGVSLAAVKDRLERGREMLRANLLRRGIAVGVPLLAGLLAPATAVAIPAFQPHTATPAASSLAHEVGAMLFPLRSKFLVVMIMAVGGFGLALAIGSPDEQKSPVPKREAKVPVPKPEAKSFHELSVTLKANAFGVEPAAAITVTPDGKCVYGVAGRPGVNAIPARPAAKVTHTLSPERLKLLTELLKASDWLDKELKKGPPQLHATDYVFNLKRDGKPSTVTCSGGQAPYAELTAFFAHLSTQEYLLYQLTSLPDSSANARHTLDSYLRAELGEPFASRPTFALDYTRFTGWATGLVRKPDGRAADDLRTAVRLVAHLRLESERQLLTELIKHENSYVHQAAIDALDWMSPEAVKLEKTLVGCRTKMPPAEGLAEQEGRTLRGMDYNQNHLSGVATRLKATTRGEALVLFAHLRDSNVNLRFIAAVGLNGIYTKYPSGFSAEAFADLESPAHRAMVVAFQTVLEAGGK